MIDLDRLKAAYEKVRDELLAERTADGHWVGELSSSALATATAVSALAVVKAATSGRGAGTRDSGIGTREAGSGGLDQVGRDVPCVDVPAEQSVLSTLYSVLGTPSSVQRDPQVTPSNKPPLTDESLDNLIHRGVAWLIRQQNPDGGFGDTDLSHSNIATTYLVVAALHLAGVAREHAELLARANQYIDSKGRLQGLRERYGIDKTFVVPIMTNLALAGLVDWREIDPLPFELACVPQSWYRFVGMPVVSYAIPALVAIGQARFFQAPPRNPLTRLIRRLAVHRSLKVLRRMQPESGGYLEATPLTSFVVMSLASKPRPLAVECGRSIGSGRQRDSSLYSTSKTATTGRGFEEEVIREGVKFLVNSVRSDGSWPIDTNLATWVTTLSINALAWAGEYVPELLGAHSMYWLLSCQHTKRHAFTGADSGGFGWSDLSGAVPDADDTPGALLAMSNWPRANLFEHSSIANALLWLLSLQNRDGGWPTFCRGWGKLPFDRSGTDLTAHAIRALRIHQPRCVSMTEARRQGLIGHALETIPRRIDQGIDKALSFLARRQNSDGSWSPLWFGNQDHPDEDNPVYGTAKVLMAYRDLELMDSPEARRGVAWLVANQNDDGGWGSGVWGKIQNAEGRMQNEAQNSTENSGPRTQAEPQAPPDLPIRNPQSTIHSLKSSLEETALAVEALLAALPQDPSPRTPTPSPATSHQPLATSISRGLAWLVERVEHDQHRQPAPIGFYFAKLWYYERLYPLIFTTAALGRACRQYAVPADSSPANTTRLS